ncbi:MAG: hypothetical protein M5T61_17070 [Acidimicrobiia bacterium]|nr:hypothetical protein [Acidimicrobiia bacterium]
MGERRLATHERRNPLGDLDQLLGRGEDDPGRLEPAGSLGEDQRRAR